MAKKLLNSEEMRIVLSGPVSDRRTGSVGGYGRIQEVQKIDNLAKRGLFFEARIDYHVSHPSNRPNAKR